MRTIILLGITSLLTDISSEMVYPLLSVFLVTALGASPALLGLIEGIAESLASLLKVFSGFLSDRLKKRKPFVMLGYASSAAGKLFLYVAGNWWYVLWGRVIDRFGKGIRTAPRDALIAESASRGSRGAAFGLHRTMDTVGAAIGVLCAYWLIVRYHGDLRIVFLLSLIPAGLGVAILFLVREAPRSASPAGVKIRFQWRGLDRRLKLFLIFTFLFTLGNSSNQFLLLRARQMGSPLATVLLLYLVYNLVYAAVAYPASKLSDRIGRKTLLVCGYCFYGLVYLGFAFNTSLANLWLLFALYGLYIGFTEGVEKALVADISPQEMRATTIGLHATLVGIGLLPASLLAGLLWKFFGPQAAFFFGGTMGLVASFGLWYLLRGV